MELNPLYRLHIQLSDKVDKLAESNNISASTDLSDIIVRLKALESKPSLESEIVNLKGVIQNLEASNNEFKDKIAYLSKIDTIEARIYNIETETKVDDEPLKERLTALEDNNYQERITTLTNRLNNIEPVANTITDLSFRLGEVEKRTDLTERVRGLEMSFANLNA
jgi:hypothetical protein